jgi:hypothetical protein
VATVVIFKSALLCAAGAILVGCMNTGTSDDQGAGTSETLSSTVPVVTISDPSDSSAPSLSTSPVPVPVPSLEDGPPNVVVTEVITANGPIGLATRHGDERLFIIEQDGLILALDLATGLPDRVADLSEWTSAQGEQGLLGLAFSSDGDLA